MTVGVWEVALTPVVVTCALRTPLCKAKKGSYKDATDAELLVATMQAAREHIGIDPSIVGDMCVEMEYL